MSSLIGCNSGVPGNAEADVPLSALTSIGFGGPADLLARPTGIADLQALLEHARDRGLPVKVLGGGTNVFVDDAGVRGLVIVIEPQSTNGLRVAGTRITAVAGTPLRRIVKAALDASLGGLEACVGIPGSVGGAVAMNAGTADGAIGDVTTAVTVIDAAGKLARVRRHEIDFGYRRSSLASRAVVEAQFDLEYVDRQALHDRAEALWRKRWSSQPVGFPSAGCVFKNPPGKSAGRLLDRARLKSTRIGGMRISRRHANFFVNVGGATFDDAMRLIDLARDTVRRAFGIELELEVKIWKDRGPQAGRIQNQLR